MLIFLNSFKSELEACSNIVSIRNLHSGIPHNLHYFVASDLGETLGFAILELAFPLDYFFSNVLRGMHCAHGFLFLILEHGFKNKCPLFIMMD